MQQELKSEFTKELIIDKAFNLFHRNGFKATSIDTIMKETTLSKGAFYYHYKSKKELGVEVISSKVRDRVVNAMILPLKEPGNSLEILEQVFINRLKGFSFYNKQCGCPMNNLINEIGNHDMVYQKALKDLVEEWKIALVQLIEKGKLEKSIKKDVSSEAVALYLISAYEGIRGIRKLYDNDIVVNEFLTGLSLFLTQIKV